jgi:hypothetical protein
VTPPNTTLPMAADSVIKLVDLRNMTVVARDNTYRRSELTTKFCLTFRGGVCYPDKDVGQLFTQTIGTGQYTLRYYSADPAGNLERVQSINLVIDNDGTPLLIEARII